MTGYKKSLNTPGRPKKPGSRRRPEAHYENARRSRARNRDLVTWVKNQPCMDCEGRFPPECMDFDHRPGEVKGQHVAMMASSSCAVVTIQREMMKCDLVCANCHRIRTKKRRREVKDAAS